VLMTWLYLSAYIIIIGGEINAFYSEKNRKGC
jgi:membrane protein